MQDASQAAARPDPAPPVAGRNNKWFAVGALLVAAVAFGIITYGGIITSLTVPDRQGRLADVVLGFDHLDVTPITFDEIRPGAWQQSERLVDMDANHVEASVCFPNVLPRFCGQAFLERDDKELALLCVQAYNDWMIDDWCGGDAHGKLIPMTMVPLWDVELAAAEVRRVARPSRTGASRRSAPGS